MNIWFPACVNHCHVVVLTHPLTYWIAQVQHQYQKCNLQRVSVTLYPYWSPEQHYSMLCWLLTKTLVNNYQFFKSFTGYDLNTCEKIVCSKSDAALFLAKRLFRNLFHIIAKTIKSNLLISAFWWLQLNDEMYDIVLLVCQWTMCNTCK